MSLKKSKNVCLKQCLLLLFLFVGQGLFAQPNELVWYFNSKEKSEVATIKTILENLKKRTADASFFTNTIYLNSLRSNEDEEFEIRKQLDRFTERGVFAQDNSNSVNKALFEKLLGFSYFLRIELEAYSGLEEKEFTFSLYKAVPGNILNSEEVELAEIDLQSVLIENAKITKGASSEAIFTKLRNAIKRLTPELNEAPIARIRVNQQEVEHYHIVDGNPLELSASYSEDVDTEQENLTYHWRQIGLNGRFNPPPNKKIGLKKQDEKATYILPDTGIYKIGLKVNDGIEDSVEDTLTVINFNCPKIILDKKSLRKRKKISVFQFLNPKNSSKKIQDDLKIVIDSEVPLDYELSYFEKNNKRSSQLQANEKQTAKNTFRINFNGKLKYEDRHQYGFFGKHGDIYTDTSYYDLKHSKFVFTRISIGVEPFIGPSILCAKPLKGDIWATAPLSVMGGIYLFHDQGASVLLEGGILWFLNKEHANRVADGFGLGKLSLKATTDFPKIAPYLALQMIGGIATNESGEKVNRQHYGLVLGQSLFKNQLDIDLLNVYYNFEDKCLTLSGGIRYNFYGFRK